MFENEMIGRKSSAKYYLPRFLSIRGYTQCSTLKDEVEAKKNVYTHKKKRNIGISKKRSQEEVLADIKTITDGHFMEMLSDDRSDDYAQWMDVGWTLFCIGQGCDECLELWKEFSKRSSKHYDGVCEEQWSSMTMKGKTIGSLIMMAKIDSPGEFKEWKESHIKTYIIRSLSDKRPNEWDVAQVVLKMYRDRFVCADSKRDVWYEFLNHRWQELDDGVTIRKLFATEVLEEYNKYKAEAATRQIGMGECPERVKLMEQEARCMTVTGELKRCPFQDKLLRMCKIVFYDGNFMKRKDENTLLFPCENGVLDLDLKLFRDGRPDDYMTQSCGHEFHPHDPDDDEVKEIDEFFRKVIPHEGRREYFLDISCSCLEGGNINKTVVFAIGDGDNGKSITFRLLELLFGKLGMKFPRELLIVGRGNTSGSARPELARCRGKHWASVQEIAKTETFNIGVFKELSGGVDSMYVRDLFEKGCEITPMFTLMIQCNEPPKIPGHDDATWNRLRIVDFESKFVAPHKLDKYPVPPTIEEQYAQKRFHANLDFGRKLPYLAPVLLSMLFKRYCEYKVRGLREPACVKLSTNVYRAMNDVYLQFVQEKIEKVEYAKGTADEEKVFLKLNTLHEEFTTWYSENHSSYAREKYNKITLEHEFNKRLGAAVTVKRYKGWYGYKIAEDEPLDPEQQRRMDLLLKKTNLPAKEQTKELKKEIKAATSVIVAKEVAKESTKETTTKGKKKPLLIDVVIPSPKPPVKKPKSCAASAGKVKTGLSKHMIEAE